ncbi:ComF family protein [Rhodococcus sp. ACT016]|uniref:ComF family protein n=1 Tax=Rhodococcus sp. ACT016 TaxID=3134808 RepID=UPI003D288A44
MSVAAGTLAGVRALLDLVLPAECGGCGNPGSGWCERCRRALADVPVAVSPRVDPDVPVWALGPYSGPRRSAIIAAKERGRRDLADPIGVALARAIATLRRWGELSPPASAPLCLVPAPSRPRAARARGGDPVLRAARAAARVVGDGCRVHPVLSTRRGVRDSVGLSAAERQENLAGRIRVSPSGRADLWAAVRAGAEVVLIDDVVTTGATAAESVRACAAVGVRVAATLVVAAA